MSKYPKKLFGVALDPSDDPWTLQLKHAWMMADPGNQDWLSACLDPYSAVTTSMAAVLDRQGIKPVGKFPTASWLWPKPNLSDLPHVTVKKMGDFFESGSLLEIAKQLQHFVKNNIFPAKPVMLGIDHSATAGVVSALAEKYSPERLSVVVLDQHFDAIPLSARLRGISQFGLSSNEGKSLGLPSIPIGFSDRFCCGNFWAYLMENNLVLPENLIVIGVADYPCSGESLQLDSYRKNYLGFEERGCSFFLRQKFEGLYYDELARFIKEKISTPYVYITLDLDVGSYACTYAARYMDRIGISEQNLMDVADIVAEGCHQGKFEIAGLDIMEFNMHFLGLETATGIKDTTLPLVGKFITALT